MTKTCIAILLASALGLAGGCATTETAQESGSQVDPLANIAAIDAALSAERDATRVPGLLFRRGHAYLEAAERVRGLHGEKSADGKISTEFMTLTLGAVNDFEAVVRRYPESAAAPEALFHLGVVYDYPNLSSLSIAMNYYQRTIESYPGTESAGKARVALDKITARMQELLDGRHGGR